MVRFERLRGPSKAPALLMVPLRLTVIEAALTHARAALPLPVVRDVRLGGQGVMSRDFLMAERLAIAMRVVRTSVAGGICRASAERNPGFLAPVLQPKRFAGAGAVQLPRATAAFAARCRCGR